MDFLFEAHSLDSALIESVWRSCSTEAGSYISVAASHWSFMFARRQGKIYVDVCGPETRATPSTIPAGSDVYGINFKVGVFMPHLPPNSLVDKRLPLQNASNRAFWLHDAALPLPGFEDAEAFAERLVRAGLLVRDPIVSASLQGEPIRLSARSRQYRFVKSTGLSRETILQIARARQAALMLEQGVAIADAVYLLGYCDQAHLTRSLKHLYGQSPTAVAQVTASTAPT